MNALSRYIDSIVEPTFEDFQRNPHSQRHAFLACVTVAHSVDRLAGEKVKAATLRQQWKRESFAFLVADMVAHKFKHVLSDEEKAKIKPGQMSLPALIFGSGTLNSYMLNTKMLNEGGIDLHNLSFLVRDAIDFLREKSNPQIPSLSVRPESC